MFKFKYDVCSIEIEEQDRGLLYFSVYKDGHRIIVGGDCENYICKEGSYEHIVYWSNEDPEEKDKYLSMFPDYSLLAKYVDRSFVQIFNIMKSTTIYGDLLKRLDDAVPIPIVQHVEHNIYPIYAEYMGDKIVSLQYDMHGLSIRVGDYEYYRDSSGSDYEYNNLDRFPQYNMLRKILKLKPSVGRLEKMNEYSTRAGDHYLDALYDLLTYIPPPIPEKIKVEKPSADSPWICIQNKESQRGEEGEGIPPCIALMRENEWNNLSLIISTYSYLFKYNEDYTSGGYACDIDYDLHKMVEECTIIKNLSPDVVEFIKKVEDTSFIDTIRDQVEHCYDDTPEPINMFRAYVDIVSKYTYESATSLICKYAEQYRLPILHATPIMTEAEISEIAKLIDVEMSNAVRTVKDTIYGENSTTQDSSSSELLIEVE